MPEALLVAAFDSQLKWVAGIRDELVGRGFSCAVVVPDVRSALSTGQIAAAGFDAVESITWPELIERAVASDVVVCGLSGPFTLRFTVDLAARVGADGSSPVVVTGWVGVIIEKITAGYLDRAGSDVVAVNCVDDLEHFVTVAQQLELEPDNLLLSGLPILGSSAAPHRAGPVRRVLFADQPTVPQPAAERLYLYQRLIDYAYAHPEREVLLKPRHRLDEDTFHTMKHHPEDLLAGVARPPNFRIDYTPISEILPEVDLLLTVSSTACLEAVGSRLPGRSGARSRRARAVRQPRLPGQRAAADLRPAGRRRGRHTGALLAGQLLLRPARYGDRADRRPGREAAVLGRAAVAAGLGLGLLHQHRPLPARHAAAGQPPEPVTDSPSSVISYRRWCGVGRDASVGD